MSTNPDLTEITPTALLSDLCPFCNESLPKYRCPACDARTCSLKCSKRHKAYKQCSGTRDPTAYIKRSKLTTPTALNRDFNFLTGVERAVARGPEVPVDDEELTKNAERKNKQAAQARDVWIVKSGVIVKRAPQGMKRSRENKTDVVRTKKARLLHWTVEWILYDEGNKSIIDGRVMETSKLTNAFFHPNNIVSRKKPKPEMAKTRFYLKKVGTPANRPTLIPLHPTAELRECIRGRMVEEYPTIYITTKEEHPQGFEVDQSIAVDVDGKLEVLDETGGEDIEQRVVIGSKEDTLADSCVKKGVSKQDGAHSTKDGTTPELEHPGGPVDENYVADGQTIAGTDSGAPQEDSATTQMALVEGALLELIGVNGMKNL